MLMLCPKTDFRSILSLAFALGCLICSSSVTTAQEKFDLDVEFAPTKQIRVASNYEHVGDVLVISEPKDDKKDSKPGVTPLRMSVEAKMTYIQRTMNQTQAIRYFENAAAKIKLDEGTTNPRLADNNRLVVARSKEKSLSLIHISEPTRPY